MEQRRIDWLRDWDRQVEPSRQRNYVTTELERLRKLGAPLLYAALTAPLVEQRDLALSVLRGTMPTVYLRLVEGAVPPPLDPQGRPLPPHDRGEVLVAKVGVRGQSMGGERVSDVEAQRYAGPNRAAVARSAEGLYHTVRITREPTPLPLDQAAVVMAQWGHGVQDNQYRRRHKPDQRVDQWIVAECDASGHVIGEPRPAPSATAPSGKRAA